VLGDKKLGGKEARLWEVCCRPATPSEQTVEHFSFLYDKGLNPTAHLLGQFKRYNSAFEGVWAVKRFISDARRLDYDLEAELGRLRLESAEGPDWVKNIEQGSSDLGFGLALLMELMGLRQPCLVATGNLGNAQDTGKFDDVVVEPVSGVPEKLRAVLEKKRSGAGFEPLRLVFTPSQYYTPDGGLDLVERLEVVRELWEAGVEVVPVRTFSEAARRLGANDEVLDTVRNQAVHRQERRKRIQRRVVTISGSVLAAILTVAAWMGVYLNKPVELTWESDFSPSTEATPFLECAGQDGEAAKPALIHKEGFTPIVPAHSRLSWQMRAGNTSETDSWGYRVADWLGYGKYHLAAVLIGETSGLGKEPVVIPQVSEQSGEKQRLRPGQTWSYGWQLGETLESSLLIVLVNRRHEFDAEALETGLRNYFNGSDGLKTGFSSVVEYLRKQSDGSIAFNFSIRSLRSPCPLPQETSVVCPRVRVTSSPSGDFVSFPSLHADSSEHTSKRYAYVSDLAGKQREPLRQDQDSGRFSLPLQGGRLYLVTAQELGSRFAPFVLSLPEAENGKGTEWHGPVPRSMRPVRLDGLPKDAQACELKLE
jgi:hypothetical protein